VKNFHSSILWSQPTTTSKAGRCHVSSLPNKGLHFSLWAISDRINITITSVSGSKDNDSYVSVASEIIKEKTLLQGIFHMIEDTNKSVVYEGTYTVMAHMSFHHTDVPTDSSSYESMVRVVIEHAV
jgi:hypothetical protein